MKPTLFHKEEECCNCKACANICPQNAIKFKLDKYGFEYPYIEEDKCIGCGCCIKVCTFKKNDQEGKTPIEGYAARHKNFDVYSKSTSGGMFTALAEYIIGKGGKVYGCAFNEQLIPCHIGVDNLNELKSIRGSKYVQSEIGNTYRSVKKNLEENKFVLFSGTPCEVNALYSFLGKTDTAKLFTVDIICHGVPSIATFKKYISYLEKKYSHNITSFQFRNKYYEWERPVICVGFGKRHKRWFTNEDVYYDSFNKGLLQRPSCFACKYAQGKRYGDFTIGDFWGYQKGNIPLTKKEGISCCLINTVKAQKCFARLNVDSVNVSIDTIIQGNTHLRKCLKRTEKWDIVMREISENGFDRFASEFYHKQSLIFHLKCFVKKIVLRKLHK